MANNYKDPQFISFHRCKCIVDPYSVSGVSSWDLTPLLADFFSLPHSICKTETSSDRTLRKVSRRFTAWNQDAGVQ